MGGKQHTPDTTELLLLTLDACNLPHATGPHTQTGSGFDYSQQAIVDAEKANAIRPQQDC